MSVGGLGIVQRKHGGADGAKGMELQHQAGKTGLVLRLLGPRVQLQHPPDVHLRLLHLLPLLQAPRSQVKPSSVKDCHRLEIGKLCLVHLEVVHVKDELVHDPVKDGDVQPDQLGVGPLNNELSRHNQPHWLPLATQARALKVWE